MARTPPRPPRATAAPPAGAAAGERPEHWSARSARGDIVTLRVPPHASRERVFDIDTRLGVAGTGAAGAWQALTLWIDGEREWQRRLPLADPAGSDGLDHHCRRRVPVGRALTVVAEAEASGARRLSLTIEASEELQAAPGRASNSNSR